jgi:two-component system sensor histidine kinase TtrS
MTKIITACFFLILPLVAGHASASDVRIGVLTIRGPGDSLKYWEQIAVHLNEKIPDHHFVIVPHTYKGTEQAVAKGQLDFVVANPAEYIDLEVKYGASRIATMVNHVGRRESSYFGTVIFTKADRTDILTLPDLRGKSLVTASKTAFASWVVTRDELKRSGVSAEDLKEVRFARSSADDVVTAVRNGEADVGAVRTYVLEQMAVEGKIALTDFRILNQKHVEGFPFLLSSELYPEFAFARLKHTDTQLANRVAAQLLLMPHETPDSNFPNMIGWTVPDNYETVRKLLQKWNLPPYEDYGKVSLNEAFRQHWVTISLIFTVLLASSLIVYLGLNIKKRNSEYAILKEAKQKLDLVHAMIEATPDAVFIKDMQGRYVFVNPVAARIIGRPAHEIIGKEASDFFKPKDAESIMGIDSMVKNSAGTITYEERSLLSDSSKCLLVTKGPMYDNKGNVDGIFVVARDIADLTRSHTEVEEKDV